MTYEVISGGTVVQTVERPWLLRWYSQGEFRGLLDRAGLETIAGCHRRVVLLHYAPVAETLVGEPEPIWAFLGSSRLEEPLNR